VTTPAEPSGDDQSLTATHWSVVLNAQSEDTALRSEALETLCRVYWYPLYCYARRCGSTPEDAQDLTQAFFAFFLEKQHFARADPERGRFRTFLLTSFRNFLTNEWKRTQTARRGGGWKAIPFDTQSAEDRYLWDRVEPANPDKAFDRSWAIATLQQVVRRMHDEYEATGKAALFEALKLRLWDELESNSCAETAARLGLTKAALKMATRRFRLRFRDGLRDEVRHTVSNPAELDAEVRYLISVLQSD
jgi:RNA polymerase sigma factor (sigma-70 family)